MKKERLDIARRHRHCTLDNWKKPFYSGECAMQQSVHRTSGGQWISVLKRNMLQPKLKIRRATWFGVPCRIAALVVCISFSLVLCKDAIKERNRALERFKREPTEGNLNAYRIARAKARRDVRLSKKTPWRNYISKLNSQASVKSVWNRIRKIKGRNPVILYIIYLSMIEMSHLIVT